MFCIPLPRGIQADPGELRTLHSMKALFIHFTDRHLGVNVFVGSTGMNLVVATSQETATGAGGKESHGWQAERAEREGHTAGHARR